MKHASILAIALTAAAFSHGQQPESFMGLIVAPENRCSAYDRGDYPYAQSVELDIVEGLGNVYGPYTGACFSDRRETDIEHIVAVSEAHDSGLCAASPATKKAFARDLLNLTLASPRVNRNLKSAKDAAEWTPDKNKCWFARRTIDVRRKYGLTIDRREAEAVRAILSRCLSTELVVVGCTASQSTTVNRPLRKPKQQESAVSKNVDALALWDNNNNGRITCAEARSHHIAPVRRGHPAYRYMDDRDNDGIVCE